MEASEMALTKFDATLTIIKVRATTKCDKDIQKEVGKLLRLANAVQQSNCQVHSSLYEVAVNSLVAEPPNIELARQIRRSIDQKLNPKSPFFRFLDKLKACSPSTHVIYGIIVLLFIAVPVVAKFGPDFIGKENRLGIDRALLGAVAFYGALGSIVSIMVRIKDFQSMDNTSPSIHFFTGLFKPIIGVSFALFVFVTIQAGMIPAINVTEGKEAFFFMAVAFITGFSERVARDIASKTEKVIVVNPKDNISGIATI